MESLRNKQAFICDMDGVIYHGRKVLPGAAEFVRWLQARGKRFLFLTNSSERSAQELQHKLAVMGLEVGAEHFWTSALATASFLASQRSNRKAYVIGQPGLMQALYDVGFTMDDHAPDYVIVGEGRNYHYEQIETAISLVLKGARLIGTNPDLTGPGEHGILPACRSLIAPIELSTGRAAYFVGKPNPLMMRHSLKHLDSRREDTVIIGDRMDTDIIAGIESEIQTVLVLSGITTREDLVRFPYTPHYIFDGVGAIVD